MKKENRPQLITGSFILVICALWIMFPWLLDLPIEGKIFLVAVYGFLFILDLTIMLIIIFEREEG